MTIFKDARGKFKKLTLGLKSDSVISIPDLGALPNGVFVENFDVTKSEKKAIIQCFNSSLHVYAFGHDPEGSNYSVTFYAFLSDGCSAGSEGAPGVENLMKFYNDNRISQKKSSVSMSVGKTGLDGIITGLRVNGVSAELNLASVTIVFTDLG